MSNEWELYGSSTKVTEKQNPLGLRLKPLPEEKICPMCDIKSEVLYPINNVVLCLPCAERIAERKDTLPVKYIPYQNLKPENVCAVCGREVYLGVKANMHICHKCTLKMAKIEKGRRIKEASMARKILSGYDVRKLI